MTSPLDPRRTRRRQDCPPMPAPLASTRYALERCPPRDARHAARAHADHATAPTTTVNYNIKVELHTGESSESGFCSSSMTWKLSMLYKYNGMSVALNGAPVLASLKGLI